MCYEVTRAEHQVFFKNGVLEAKIGGGFEAWRYNFGRIGNGS